MMVINYYDELYMYCEVFCIQYYEIPCIYLLLYDDDDERLPVSGRAL